MASRLLSEWFVGLLFLAFFAAAVLPPAPSPHVALQVEAIAVPLSEEAAGADGAGDPPGTIDPTSSTLTSGGNSSDEGESSSVGADPAQPNAPSPTASRLTLAEALVLAEKNNPQLSEAAAHVARSHAGVQTARAYSNPSLDLMEGGQSRRPIATPGVPGLLQHYGISQTLEIPSERRARIRASRLAVDGALSFQEAMRRTVIAEVKQAFYGVLRQKQELRYTQENFHLVDDLRRRVEVRVNVGEAGRLELTRAEAELARARAQVSSARVELARAEAMLRTVIGAPPGAVYDPQGKVEEPVKLRPLAELRTQVLSSHPALAEAQADVARDQARVEDEEALRIPRPTFTADYEIQPDLRFYQFGVSLPLPLWDRRKGPIAEAAAQMRQSQATERRRRMEMVAALDRAYDQYELMDQQVESLQSGSLREAKAAVEAAQAAYQYGERGILDVLDAQRVLQGVREDLLTAIYARQSALIDLEELGATP